MLSARPAVGSAGSIGAAEATDGSAGSTGAAKGSVGSTGAARAEGDTNLDGVAMVSLVMLPLRLRASPGRAKKGKKVRLR